jgi:hypothetical protein
MLVYFIGLFGSIFVHLGRAGLLRVNRSEFVLANVGWFLMLMAKSFAWPAVLVVWLVRGMPEGRWQAVTEIDGQPVRRIVHK